MTEITTTEQAAVAALEPAAVRQVPAIEHAIKTGATPEQMLALFQLQVQMDNHQLTLMRQKREWDREDRAVQAKREYDEAMVKFRKACPNVLRLKDIKEGPRAGAKHADLDAVVDTATQHLSDNGFTASWRPTITEKDWIEIECRLQHVGGHFEAVRFNGPIDSSGAKNGMQGRKSSVTYLERITMLLVCGLAEADADDDGAGAAVGKRDGEDLGAGLALAKALDDAGGVVQEVGPGTVGVEGEAAIGTRCGRLGHEGGATAGGEGAVGGNGVVFLDDTGARCADGFVGAENGDDDGAFGPIHAAHGEGLGA